MPIWLLKIRALIGKVADVLIAGRAAGLWNKGKGPEIKPKS